MRSSRSPRLILGHGVLASMIFPTATMPKTPATSNATMPMNTGGAMQLRHNGNARTFVSVVRNCCDTGTRGARFTAADVFADACAAEEDCDAAAAAAAAVLPAGRVLPPVSGAGT